MIVGTIQDYSPLELAGRIRVRSSSHRVVAYIDRSGYVHVDGAQSARGVRHACDPVGFVGTYITDRRTVRSTIERIVEDIEATVAESALRKAAA